jgi:hypothetical protein
MATITVSTACDTAPHPAPWIAPELNSPSTSPKFLCLMRHTDSGEYLQAPVVVTGQAGGIPRRGGIVTTYAKLATLAELRAGIAEQSNPMPTRGLAARAAGLAADEQFNGFLYTMAAGSDLRAAILWGRIGAPRHRPTAGQRAGTRRGFRAQQPQPAPGRQLCDSAAASRTCQKVSDPPGRRRSQARPHLPRDPRARPPSGTVRRHRDRLSRRATTREVPTPTTRTT